MINFFLQSLSVTVWWPFYVWEQQMTEVFSHYSESLDHFDHLGRVLIPSNQWDHSLFNHWIWAWVFYSDLFSLMRWSHLKHSLHSMHTRLRFVSIFFLCGVLHIFGDCLLDKLHWHYHSVSETLQWHWSRDRICNPLGHLCPKDWFLTLLNFFIYKFRSIDTFSYLQHLLHQEGF